MLGREAELAGLVLELEDPLIERRVGDLKAFSLALEALGHHYIREVAPAGHIFG